MKYAVTFVNRRTGEQRDVIVGLTTEEMLDCRRQAVNHGLPAEAGWPPLEKRYAANRAAADMPEEFTRALPEVFRVVVH